MIRFFLCCVLMVLIGCDDSCNTPLSSCEDVNPECSEDVICPEGYECRINQGIEQCIGIEGY